MKNRKDRIAAIVAFGLFLMVGYCVISLTEIPLKNRCSESTKRFGALAIRDNVTPFQKFGSMLFTMPLLEKGYHSVAYFTQYRYGDKRDEIILELNELLEENDSVDVFLLAHTNYFIDYVAELSVEKRYRIRMVYNTGCGNAYQWEEWSALGVKSYISHYGKGSLSPLFYLFFLRRWTKGWTLQNAVEESNKLAVNLLLTIDKLAVGQDLIRDRFNPKASMFGKCHSVIK